MIGLEQFKADALALMRDHLKPRHVVEGFSWGDGSDDVSILGDRELVDELAELERSRAWQAIKFDAGFGWIQGPVECGGRGLPQEYSSAFNELESNFEVPDRIFFGVGHGMVGPTIVKDGSEDTRRYLKPIYRADLVCCQLFSEPGAGSDLAAVSTFAATDGDDWVVNGQKVWTSGAQYSDLGLLLARTNHDVPKHRGITVFLVDMKLPGVEVRPLRQMTGGTHFNEVFFDNVRVPDSHRLGPVDEGWRVATGTLLNERASLGPGGSNANLGDVPFGQLVAVLQHFGVDDDPTFRQEIAEIYSRIKLADVTVRRLLARTPAGEPPGPELSICKTLNTDLLDAIAEMVARVLGPRITADTGEWGTFAWTKYLLAVPGMRLGGGTDQIQKNILSERVLGLPREPQA